MIEITWGCAQCPKTGRAEIAPEGTLPSIEGAILQAGWVIQKNGEHTDIYCSAKCAL